MTASLVYHVHRGGNSGEAFKGPPPRNKGSPWKAQLPGSCAVLGGLTPLTPPPPSFRTLICRIMSGEGTVWGYLFYVTGGGIKQVLCVVRSDLSPSVMFGLLTRVMSTPWEKHLN